MVKGQSCSANPDRGTLRRTRNRRVQLGAWLEARAERKRLPGHAGHRRRSAFDDQLRLGASGLQRTQRGLLAKKPAGQIRDTACEADVLAPARPGIEIGSVATATEQYLRCSVAAQRERLITCVDHGTALDHVQLKENSISASLVAMNGSITCPAIHLFRDYRRL
jgi:hypothetical protein